MAQIRFFQYLNENDINFQKVTTLDFIDNSEGFTMYYFKDGSKCNKQFIAPVNSETIKGYEFAEISNPNNKWILKKVEPTLSKEKPKTAVGKDGVIYEAPDISDFGLPKPKTRIDIIGKPFIIDDYIAPDDTEYYYQNIVKNNKEKEPIITTKNSKSFDFNDSTTIEVPKPASEFIILKDADVTSYIYDLDKNGVLHINADEFLRNIKSVQIEINGTACELSTEDFIENAITPKEEKVIEKVVEKEVLVKTSDTDIELGVNNDQKSLIDNMINMSNKTEYSIDIEFALNLPPSSIYKLIKTAYPKEMSKGFINILANRMQIKELKTSVADGLLAFYDEDIAEDFNTEVKEEQPANNIQKASRAKKATNN